MNPTWMIATRASKAGIRSWRKYRAELKRKNYTALLDNARSLEEARDEARRAVAGESQHQAGGEASTAQIASLAEQARRRLDEALDEAKQRKEQAAKSSKKFGRRAKKQAKKAAAQASATASELWEKAGNAAEQVKEEASEKAAAVEKDLKKRTKKQRKAATKATKKAQKQAAKAAKKAEKKAQRKSTTRTVFRRAGFLSLLVSVLGALYYFLTNRKSEGPVADTPPTTADYEHDELANSVRETRENLVYSSETPIFDEVADEVASEHNEPLEGAAERDEELLQSLDEQLASLESEDPEANPER